MASWARRCHGVRGLPRSGGRCPPLPPAPHGQAAPGFCELGRGCGGSGLTLPLLLAVPLGYRHLGRGVQRWHAGRAGHAGRDVPLSTC